MIELRFEEALYDGFAIDEAAKTFAPFASIDRERHDGAFILRVTLSEQAAADGHAEPDVAAELANHALGKTVERRGATT